MSEELFYTAPSDKVFNEMQKLAIDIWSGYDDTHKYATEKINFYGLCKDTCSNVAYTQAQKEECRITCIKSLYCEE